MKTFLMIGMGNFGHLLVREFAKQQCEMMIVDHREEALEDLLSLGVSAKIGDCTNRDVLESFDVPSFDACFVSVGSDFQTSLEITSLLKELGAVKVISKAGEDVQAKFLLKNGADHVIYPEQEAAESIAVSECNDSIFDCIPMVRDFNVYEISVPARWVGKTIRELNIRANHDVIILAVMDGEKLVMPSAGYTFTEKEHLLVMGTAESIRSVTDN